ncbi:alanyl-tRNA editing protein [Candidatus Woesearchaeota archaeon]|nr:alanyl-tRNA editing protein [Candidatus Woesearchaeota archaeon]
MTQAAYLLDCYTKEFVGTVKSVKDDKFVVLEETYFYPQSGGQPFDTGRILKEDGSEHNVVFVGKFGGEISHEVDKPGLKAGDKVRCVIDWDRRYKHMRMHTAAHVLSNVIEKDAGALITGNQLGLQQSRIDFSLEDFDREKFKEYEAHANRIVSEGHDVNLFLMSRDEAEEKVERLSGLAKGLPPEIREVRLVEIEGLVIEACGGTHLANTSEIKGIRITKMENKGAKNRRVYFELAE